MIKRICSVLCTWLLIGVMLVYGAKGSNLTEVRHSTENRNLTENSNTVTLEKDSEPEMPKVTEETEVAEATEMIESDAEQLDWKQAYLAKAEEMESAGHPLKYDLIYLDANDIPELVAAPTKGGFYLYTWKDGKVCELINCKGLTDGEYGYEAYQGIIGKNVNTTGHTLYLSVTEKTEKESSYVKGRWLVLAGRYDLSTLSSLLEQQVDLWEQEEWGQGEWKQEECEVTKEDIDFDSRPDLLIFEGRSHGVKNDFQHYRVMRWDEVQGQFVYYPSFPFWIFYMNLEEKQVIYKAKDGASDRIVRIYEVVEGEYRVTQEMHMSTESVSEEYRGKTLYPWLEILSYYEDGELVWECDVSGMSWDEMEEPCRERGLSEIFSYTRDYG